MLTDVFSQELVFIILPTRQDLAEPSHDSASVGPEGRDTWHPSNTDDLRCDDLPVPGVHELISPVQLIASNPETELVVEAVCGEHV